MASKDITGLPGYLPPDRRPKCRLCGKLLRPFVVHEWEKVETDGGYHSVLVPVRVAYHGCDAHELFCSRGCGYAYGVNAAKRRAGY